MSKCGMLACWSLYAPLPGAAACRVGQTNGSLTRLLLAAILMSMALQLIYVVGWLHAA